jgi:hypothetical protein
MSIKHEQERMIKTQRDLHQSPPRAPCGVDQWLDRLHSSVIHNSLFRFWSIMSSCRQCLLIVTLQLAAATVMLCSGNTIVLVNALAVSTPLKSCERRNPAVLVSAQIIDGLRASYPSCSSNADDISALKLNLETDFFDPATGLHSEGVWHNALVGIACLQQDDDNQHYYKASQKIADSLVRYSWDGTSFRRRSRSGQWDHSALLRNPSNENGIKLPEQANYYRASSEHRCIQHGMAVIFWSQLVRAQQQKQDKTETTRSIILQQWETITKQFIEQFWDSSHNSWTTVSKEQGGGTLARPSASAGKVTDNVASNKRDKPYYRAVDQAIAVLACVEAAQVLEGLQVPTKNANQETATTTHGACLMDLVQRTCQTLMAPVSAGGFGYGDMANINNAQTYRNLNRNCNFWHEGWVLLALIRARKVIWPHDTDYGELQLHELWNAFLQRYGHANCRQQLRDDDNDDPDSAAAVMFDGTVWHWDLQLKSPEHNIRYCGDNVLAFAICRNLGIDVPEHGQFWSFVDELRRLPRNHDNKNDDQNNKEKHHLASVADVYPQVRLHPNTELAALLVWP